MRRNGSADGTVSRCDASSRKSRERRHCGVVSAVSEILGIVERRTFLIKVIEVKLKEAKGKLFANAPVSYIFVSSVWYSSRILILSLLRAIIIALNKMEM